MKTIITLKDAIGKTLTGVAADGRTLFLTFGEQFTWFEADSGFENEPKFEEQTEFPWPGRHYSHIINAGIATPQELQEIFDKAEQERLIANENRERSEYERLKAKFEGGYNCL